MAKYVSLQNLNLSYYGEWSSLRAVIVELKLPALPPLIEETKTMAQNIGYEVVATLIQRRKSVHHTYTLGPGRLDELKQLVDENDVDTVIFANALTSATYSNLLNGLAGKFA
ncbi:MAG: hypothetical protein ACHQ03_01135 [Candidatus Bathyarchaeia archaeon]